MFQLNKIIFVTLLVSGYVYSATALCERATPTSWLFPGPTCEQFISCSNGREYIMDCPAGLHFSVAEDQCEWPYIAGCTGGSGTTTVAPPPPPSTTTSASPSDAICAGATLENYLFPGPVCTQFYSCSNGKAYLFDCPADLHFSVTANRCEWQDIAGCASPGTTVAPPPATTTTEAPPPPPPSTTTSAPPSDAICAGATLENYLFPGPVCTQFYSCSNGRAYLFDCPADLHFSVSANRCEWQDIAGCASPGTTVAPPPSASTTTEAPPPPPSTTTSAPPSDAICAGATLEKYLFPGPVCTQFYSCSNGKAYLFDCPADLHFSVSANRCEWQDIAGCASPGTTVAPPPSASTTTEAPPPPPSTTTSAPPSDAICVGATLEKYLFPGPVCTQFYSCSNGKAYLFDCPADLHFSVSANRCEWQDIAGCASPGTTVAPPPATTTTEAPPPPPPSTTTSAPPSDAICAGATLEKYLFPGPVCTQFYSCSNGKAYLFDCPADLHFSVSANRCEWQDIAGCASPGTTVVPPPSASTTTEAPPPPPSTTTSAPPSDAICAGATLEKYLFPGPVCTQFYSCSNGKAYLFDCPADLHFSVSANRCEWQDIAGCASPGTTVVPPPSASTTTEAPPPPPSTTTSAPPSDAICAGATLEKYLFPGPVCTQFYSCSNGKAYLFDCPADLHFSVSANRCEWQDIAGCASPGTTVAPPPVTTTTEAPPPPPSTTTSAPPSDAICAGATLEKYLFPGPVCTQFYSCSNGRAYLFDCPADLHFSVSANRCEWQDIAGCASPGTTVAPPPPPPPSTTSSPPLSDAGICAGATLEKYLFPGPVCAQFYSCSNGIAYLFDCPADLHFSVTANRCEWQDIAGCA